MDTKPPYGSTVANLVQITPPEGENVAPNVQSRLTVGTPLPPLGDKCKVPTQLFKNLPRGMEVMYSPNDPSLPLELLDLTSPEWRKAKFLKKHFPVRSVDSRNRFHTTKSYNTCPFWISTLPLIWTTV